jgi:hypothetical protein
LDTRNYWETFTGKDRKGAYMIMEQVNTDRALAIRKGNLKYISYTDGRAELYDLEIDPSETNNIINTYPDLAARMDKELMQLKSIPLNAIGE